VPVRDEVELVAFDVTKGEGLRRVPAVAANFRCAESAQTVGPAVEVGCAEKSGTSARTAADSEFATPGRLLSSALAQKSARS
jgi:hypothetical protein